MINRCIIINGGFGLEHLDLVERDIPEPGHGEVLVRIEAVSLNRRDVLLAQGVYNPKQKLPIVPCSDGAGIIAALGPGCTRHAVGDRVVIHMFPGWLAGEPDRDKLATGLGGPRGDGTLRQYMVMREDSVVALPRCISTEAAATLPCAALTAWSAIVESGQTRAGDSVLIQGTGGVSLFALQFARMCGAHVVATTSSAEKAERLKALGANAVVNYRTDRDWASTARDLAGGRIDLIVDVGGAETLDAGLRVVRPGGTIALVGVLSGAKAEINLPLALMRQVRLQGVTCGSRESLEAMLRAIALHGVYPVIDSRFPLAEARSAFVRMAESAHVGKIVVLPH